MSAAQRGGELERFRSAPDVHVMLFSLMAGSTGLNLTVRGRNSFPPQAALAWQQAAGGCFLNSKVANDPAQRLLCRKPALEQAKGHHDPASLGKPTSRQGTWCTDAGKGT